MKKKPQTEPVVSPEILELAKKSLVAEQSVRTKVCAVCGAACTRPVGPAPDEDLCWVCRRLKISAWRDSDGQVAAQE